MHVAGQLTGDLRLVSKMGLLSTNYSISEGRLEVYRNSLWGTVCNRFFFGQLEADTACKQLGFIRSRNQGRALDLGYLEYEIRYSAWVIMKGPRCPMVAGYVFWLAILSTCIQLC